MQQRESCKENLQQIDKMLKDERSGCLNHKRIRADLCQNFYCARSLLAMTTSVKLSLRKTPITTTKQKTNTVNSKIGDSNIKMSIIIEMTHVEVTMAKAVLNIEKYYLQTLKNTDVVSA